MAGFVDYLRLVWGYKSSHKTIGPGIEITVGSVNEDPLHYSTISKLPEYSTIGQLLEYSSLCEDNSKPEYSSLGYPLEYRSEGNAVAITLAQTRQISEGETRVVYVDFSEELPVYTLSGTPTVAEVTTSDLTLSGKALNTATVEINGSDVAASYAVKFTVSGQQAGTTYRIRITVGTTNSETIVRDILLETAS